MNRAELDLGQYPRIVVPQGVRPVAPEFVSPERMNEIRLAHRPGQPVAALDSFAEGHTKTYFYLRFDNFHSQWRRERPSGATADRWVFTGGVIHLSVAVKIYVVNHREPGPDPTRRAVFALIMEHEYHHIADELDIVTNHLPARILQNRTVQTYLVQRQPVLPDVFASTFAGYANPRAISENVWFRQEALNGIDLELNMLNLYTVAHNRRTHRMDGPDGEVGRYQARIAALSRAMQLGRPWSGGAGDDPWRDSRSPR